MNTKFAISIGRQFGSGGREVGVRLSELMSVNYYDKKLISEAAKRSGLSGEYIEQAEERTPGLLFYALSLGYDFNRGFTCDSIFNIEAEIINDIAAKESCIIIGRCADYILRRHPNCLNVFIHAPEEIRIKRVSERENISPKEAADLIRKIDKTRLAYYDFYTNKKWGASPSYHLSIDSSVLGIEKSAEFICKYAKTLFLPEKDI
jgi:cytidylate kinase